MQGRIRSEIETRERGRVAWLTLDRPAKRNALDRAMIDGLAEELEELAEDAALRVVVVTGAGDRAFSAGADLATLAALDAGTAEDFIRALSRACRAARDCPVPVVARLNGACQGGALEFAASCDLRAAVAGASFAMPEVRVGLPSVIEAALLPRLVGWGRATELMMTGRPIDAGTALAWGLVERVADDLAGLDAIVEGWVEALLAAAPHAMRHQKRLMREWERLPPDAAIEAGVAAFRRAFEESDEPGRWLAAALGWPRSS